MQEEFHGDLINGVTVFKSLYKWNSINVSVWLPSLSELTGVDLNHYRETTATYLSAMQGLNLSSWYDVDKQGGSQFAWSAQYNVSGGGDKLWLACNQEISWLRSPSYSIATHAWRIVTTTTFNTMSATASHAVHPAVSLGQSPYLVDASFISLGLVFIVEMIDSR